MADTDCRSSGQVGSVCATAIAVPMLSTEDIAARIGVGRATVNLHVTSARARLRCASRRDVVELFASTGASAAG
jgi:hypothetical protein